MIVDKAKVTNCCVYLGFVIGIENDSFGLWMNALATSLHKFVMAFSIGVDLVSSQVTSLIQQSSSDVGHCLHAGINNSVQYLHTYIWLCGGSWDSNR